MNRLFSLIAIAAAVCGPAQAAGVVHLVTVTNVDARSNGEFLVSFSLAITTPPACATDLTRMSGNANSAGGKAVLAAAMLAYTTGSVVFAQGTGLCTEYSGIESISILSQRR